MNAMLRCLKVAWEQENLLRVTKFQLHPSVKTALRLSSVGGEAHGVESLLSSGSTRHGESCHFGGTLQSQPKQNKPKQI